MGLGMITEATWMGEASEMEAGAQADSEAECQTQQDSMGCCCHPFEDQMVP